MDAPLYVPANPDASRTFQFVRRVNAKYRLALDSYSDLYKWSTTQIDDFWGTVWDETAIIGEKGGHVVDRTAKPAANPAWFSEAKLNWTENMLHCRSAQKVALVQATEPTADAPSPPLRRVTYSELYNLVADLVSALLSYGLQPGDRVASYSSNCTVSQAYCAATAITPEQLLSNVSLTENVAACLATTAIGCIWVSAAADFGPAGVLERFEQVQPAIIFAVDAVVYNAKVHPHLPKLSSLLSGLSKNISLQPKIVIIHSASQPSDRTGWDKGWMSWESFLDAGKAAALGRDLNGEIEWKRQAFDWPIWILFSSGTTGRPKPIVHRAGGMLLQSKKEFVICADLQPDDVFFYYTTTGWMMWNFLVSGLSIGCTLVLYDGSPLRDPSYLWRLTDELKITIFGTSAKYIDQLAKVYKPREHHNLSSLRHIYSTGSPLAPPLYDYVYQHIHPNVLLASITGGTDICSLFAGMSSALPVHRGELQCRLPGMAIETYTPTGTPSGPGEAGELVCLQPFPCQPIGFWPLPGYGTAEAVEAAAVRYRQAYFSHYPDVWYHGDHVVITPQRAGNAGGLVMLGRSDGVLNPGGVRFGSAEIYDIIEMCFSHSATSNPSHIIVDCLVVGQSIDGGMDERVILFVQLKAGEPLSLDLQKKIILEIRTRRTPRHVPAMIIQVEDIPYTLNSKRVEVPVKKIINGAPVSSVNLSTLRNPECLVAYAALRDGILSLSQ